jgi:hypothetical protein
MQAAHLAKNPPNKKEGWYHSDQVLVYYEACPEAGITDKWGIAYYLDNPPFNGPQWVDFDNPNRTPAYWWELPTTPTATSPVAS